MQERARVAIDLGAESCRVSLLRWIGGKPSVRVIHRIPNGPVHEGDSLHWPLDSILAGLEEGLAKAASAAPEGIASVAVDCWGADYVRLAPDGRRLYAPFCYRDERTVASKEAADLLITPFDLFQRTGVLPMRLNDIYQLCADSAAGVDPAAPWVSIPEYILYWLGAPRVAEYTRATHTGLVNLQTRDWDRELFGLLGLDIAAAPPVVHAGDVVGRLQGRLASLDGFKETELIVPGCHDTASAIAGIPTSLENTLYISSGTWSLVGTCTAVACTTREAFDAGYTNLGAATGDLLFHSVINSMWVLKQCMDGWAAAGRPWKIEELVQKAGRCDCAGVLDMDAAPLMLDTEMPQRINGELKRLGFGEISDVPGNEAIFARTIFESLARRYASATANLEKVLGHKIERIHMIGGATRNKLLVELTERHTGLKVEVGETESSTIGNLAIQLAASEAAGGQVTPAAIRKWAERLCRNRSC